MCEPGGLDFVDELRPHITTYLCDVDERLNRQTEDGLLHHLLAGGGALVYAALERAQNDRWAAALEKAARPIPPRAVFGAPPPSSTLNWGTPPPVGPDGAPRRHLEFTSAFESGNLKYAVFRPATDDSGVDTYELVLDFDRYTAGHTQWFHFAVRGGQAGQKVRFKIVNMCKIGSLYNQGMQPLVFSEKGHAMNAARVAAAQRVAAEQPPAPPAPEPRSPKNAGERLSVMASAQAFHGEDRYPLAYEPQPDIGWIPNVSGYQPISREPQPGVRYGRNRYPRIQPPQSIQRAPPPAPEGGEADEEHPESGREDDGDDECTDHADDDPQDSGAEDEDQDEGSDQEGQDDPLSDADPAQDPPPAEAPDPTNARETPEDAERAAQFAHMLQRKRERELGKHYYHTLQFEYTFEFDDDCVFFAYHFPYTYSMLRTHLEEITADESKGRWVQRKPLCLTLGGVECDLVQISNWDVPKRYKKTIVYTSRVHPGETNASWICHGLINFLVSSSAEAQVLRDRFVFKIVPMLNPDGVILGNYRCSLAGVDLNRQWRKPNRELHRTIFEAKKLIRGSQDVALFCDIHGHSKKLGIFTYGLAGEERDSHYYLVRLYPKLMSYLCKGFKYASCSWRQGRGKRGTGRVVVAKDLQVSIAYTLEASFLGFLQNGQVQPFRRRNLELAGAQLAQSCVHLHRLGPEVERVLRGRQRFRQQQQALAVLTEHEDQHSQGTGTELEALTDSAPGSGHAETRSRPSRGSGENSAPGWWLVGPLDRTFDDPLFDRLPAATLPAELETPEPAAEADPGFLDDVLEEVRDLDEHGEFDPDDDPPNGEESAGSASDPSEDNLPQPAIIQLQTQIRRLRKRGTRRRKKKKDPEKQRSLQKATSAPRLSSFERVPSQKDLGWSSRAVDHGRVVAFGRTTFVSPQRSEDALDPPRGGIRERLARALREGGMRDCDGRERQLPPELERFRATEGSCPFRSNEQLLRADREQREREPRKDRAERPERAERAERAEREPKEPRDRDAERERAGRPQNRELPEAHWDASPSGPTRCFPLDDEGRPRLREVRRPYDPGARPYDGGSPLQRSGAWPRPSDWRGRLPAAPVLSPDAAPAPGEKLEFVYKPPMDLFSQVYRSVPDRGQRVVARQGQLVLGQRSASTGSLARGAPERVLHAMRCARQRRQPSSEGSGRERDPERQNGDPRRRDEPRDPLSLSQSVSRDALPERASSAHALPGASGLRKDSPASRPVRARHDPPSIARLP